MYQWIRVAQSSPKVTFRALLWARNFSCFSSSIVLQCCDRDWEKTIKLRGIKLYNWIPLLPCHCTTNKRSAVQLCEIATLPVEQEETKNSLSHLGRKKAIKASIRSEICVARAKWRPLRPPHRLPTVDGTDTRAARRPALRSCSRTVATASCNASAECPAKSPRPPICRYSDQTASNGKVERIGVGLFWLSGLFSAFIQLKEMCPDFFCN